LPRRQAREYRAQGATTRRHCRLDQRIDWAQAGDDLPRFDSMHDGLSKYLAVPPRR
jgi:hypothetical protein